MGFNRDYPLVVERTFEWRVREEAAIGSMRTGAGNWLRAPGLASSSRGAAAQAFVTSPEHAV
jgi:hypothetical protein